MSMAYRRRPIRSVFMRPESCDQFVRDAPASADANRRSNLPLGTRCVNQSFHGAIQIGVFKNMKGDLPQFEGKLLWLCE